MMKLIGLVGSLCCFFLMLFTSSWYWVWFWLELNTMCVILSLVSEKFISPQSLTKYFLVQSALSLAIVLSPAGIGLPLGSVLLVGGVGGKLGLYPFYSWMVEVFTFLEGFNFFNIMTLQKLPPLLLLTYCNLLVSSFFVVWLGGLTAVFSSVDCLKESNLNSILILSSSSLMGWFSIASLAGTSLHWKCFFIYSVSFFFFWLLVSQKKIKHLSDFFFLSSKNFVVSCKILNLMGLPPFPLFLVKMNIFIASINSSISFVLFLMLASSSISGFYYLRILMLILLKSSQKSLLKSSHLHLGEMGVAALVLLSGITYHFLLVF